MREVANKRDIKLSDYQVSQAKYNELKYFCLQYDEKKRALHDSYGLRAVAFDGMPKGTRLGNPTESAAMYHMMLQKDLELIENTARDADADISKWLIRNVTQGIPYEWMDVPKGRKQFYESRRYFFCLLADRR